VRGSSRPIMCPPLLDRGPRAPTTQGIATEFREADAEALPFADASFGRGGFHLRASGSRRTRTRPQRARCGGKRGGKLGALPNGRPEASSARCQDHRQAFCRRQPASKSAGAYGAGRCGITRCSDRRHHRSNSSSASSWFATARRQGNWLESSRPIKVAVEGRRFARSQGAILFFGS